MELDLYEHIATRHLGLCMLTFLISTTTMK